MAIINVPELSAPSCAECSEPWFVGKDVAEALGYGEGKSLPNAVANHVDDEDKGVIKMMTPGGEQNVTIINESGLYSLVLSSSPPSSRSSAKPRNAIAIHVDDEDNQNCQNSSFESPRVMTIINESGLYSLVLSSKQPFKHCLLVRDADGRPQMSTAGCGPRGRPHPAIVERLIILPHPANVEGADRTLCLPVGCSLPPSCAECSEPWFVGKDVAEALGYTNPQKAIRDHVDEDDKLTERIVLSGQNREVVIINESGLNSFILSSKQPFKHCLLVRGYRRPSSNVHCRVRPLWPSARKGQARDFITPF